MDEGEWLSGTENAKHANAGDSKGRIFNRKVTNDGCKTTVIGLCKIVG